MGTMQHLQSVKIDYALPTSTADYMAPRPAPHSIEGTPTGLRRYYQHSWPWYTTQGLCLVMVPLPALGRAPERSGLPAAYAFVLPQMSGVTHAGQPDTAT